MKALTEILFLFILVFFAAVTAASEISIIAASRIKLKRLAAEGSSAAKIVLKILETPERFFSTILVTNNIVDTLIAVIVTGLVIRLMGSDGGWNVVVSTVVAAFLIIVFEVTAKTIAARYAERTSFLLARPVRLLIKVSAPVVWGLEIIINGLTKLLGAGGDGKSSLVTEEEIRSFIKLGALENAAHREKYKMLAKVFDFNETLVKNVMTAKPEIMAIDVDAKLDAILEQVLESGYSRLPVYKDSAENIIGMINMKDLLSLSFNKDLIVLQDIVYPATFVAESKKVTDLLREFQKGHMHLAVVTDIQDRIIGIVTLEDLIEEIVGEIEDEHDVRVTNYKTKRIT